MSLILRGVLLIARGRAQGLNCFRDTPRAFLISLIPGLGILTGAVVQSFARGRGIQALAEVPVTLCLLLAPAVLSYELARFWGRDAFWLRYIVAFNWCQWLLPVLGVLFTVGLVIVRGVGVGADAALGVFIIALGFYAMWLNWFIARHGLALPVGRAIALVVGVNLGTVALVIVPLLLAATIE